MLSVAEDNSTDKGYLLEQLHTSNRWPILLFNINCQLNGNMYTEIQKHSSYTILISGQCQEGEKLRSVSMKQLLAMSEVMDLKLKSWKTSARYFVTVVANCTYFNNANISRSILSHHWNYHFTNVFFLFVKSHDHESKTHITLSTRHVLGTAHLVSL